MLEDGEGVEGEKDVAGGAACCLFGWGCAGEVLVVGAVAVVCHVDGVEILYSGAFGEEGGEFVEDGLGGA